MEVRFDRVTKRFGSVVAVDDVSFAVSTGELFFLVGPSGCGKTTILRTVAGFYQPDAGAVWFGDRKMDGVPAHKRNAGMVFQNYALWPHMTVGQNVAYGLRVRGLSREEVRRRVDQALDVVRMPGYADRLPNQLSGGQQQRVALARALVIEPDVLLFDEPLSNLDAKLRLEMREEIQSLHQRLGITTIYVTHDQKEALSLADRMAVMRGGRVEQVGSPREVYRRPANAFIADFIGEANLVEARVEALDGGGMVRVRTVMGNFEIPSAEVLETTPGARILIGMRPESFQLDGNREGFRGIVFEAGVEGVLYLGSVEQYRLGVGEGRVVLATESNPRSHRRRGARVRVGIAAEDLLILPKPSEETLRAVDRPILLLDREA
ncbi:MAG TPA: spermidine/putrescine ABC transporter ATP-binding protein [Verrucomicrobia bacterium]|nr:spermidine/putrescine ABC transporter ATP-binding protein [Verrucomicrobiota bacterium]